MDGTIVAPRLRTALARAFAFPNPVNEYAARSTAGGVVVLGLFALLSGWGWLLWLIAAGFWLRLAGGPRYSPLGRLSVHVIAPRLGTPKLVPGPPKRFAQGIGVVFSTVSAALWTAALSGGGSGFETAAWAVLGVLIVAASLEAFAGFCLGCWVFARLQSGGLIPESVCEACANIALRRP